MAQITIYLPDEIERKVRTAAKKKRQSLSRWIAEQVVHSVKEGWPKGVLDAAGAIPDFPDLEDIRSGYGKGVRRVRPE